MGQNPSLSTDPDSTPVTDAVRTHYERHPYPHFSLLASVRRCDTYGLNADALWAHANGTRPPQRQQILIAGCGSFSPYPTSIANPGAAITAVDLSQANLRRARLHALLHRCRNIEYIRGDILHTAPGPFSFIDCYGVLHHLPDPLAGLKTLERRLAPGGVMRIMVYSHGARREVESVRRALAILQVRDVASLKKMIRNSRSASRLGVLLDASPEADFDSGLADMFLHPRVATFRVDEFLAMVASAGLSAFRFAHRGAVPDTVQEVDRLRCLERAGDLDVNFTAYLRRAGTLKPTDLSGSVLVLNGALNRAVRFPHFRPIHVAPKFGVDNPLLDTAARRFLRTFCPSRPYASLSQSDRRMAKEYMDAFFLVPVWPDAPPPLDKGE